ncbi:MAG TPA: DUF4013 domain-containing protein [Vicinamibacteria bacterium]|nr:DUF4013 domain-containing protein [Vicinamibacteria bacterium]
MSSAAPPVQGSVDFGRSFTFVTEDPEWVKKILIGGAFALACSLLIGVPFVLGYVARTLRNVVAGEPQPMPQWDDLGGIFSDGLRLTVVYLLYVLGFVAVLSGLGCIVVLPMMALSGSGSRASEALGLLGGLGIVALYGVVMVLSLVLFVYLPAVLARVAMRGTVADGFAWREALAFIQANLGNYLLSLVIYLLASFLAQFGILLCCVGVFPAIFWAYLVMAVALGQTVRLSRVPI